MTTSLKETSVNWPRIIAGAIVFAAGLLLVVLTMVLPGEDMMFMIGDQNLPIVPAIFVTGLGLVIMFTARKGGKRAENVEVGLDPIEAAKVEERKVLNSRLETVAWGLFLIMLGGLAFVPDEYVPAGAWSIGIGLIMLGLNGARYHYGLRMSGFTTVLGILALAGGIAQLLGVNLLDGALLIIILGVYLILRPWFDKKRLFGKAEEG